MQQEGTTMRKKIILLILTLLLTGCSAKQVNDNYAVQVTGNKDIEIDKIFNSINNDKDPGLTALVAIDGKVIYRKGFGMANIDKSIKNYPETTFRIGSITKQFTATAILLLQEQGLLSLDDTLSLYIPDFPKGETVTIYHLLTHTSGINFYTSESDLTDLVTKPVKTIDYINKIKTLEYFFEPGEEFRYSNSGYFILGYIIERVSGKNYGTYLSEQVFTKLNMKDTGVYVNGTEMDHEAIGYSSKTVRTVKKFIKALDWDMTWAGGAGNLYSNINDLFLWNEALFNGEILSEKSLKLAFTPAKLNDGSVAIDDYFRTNYGLGWYLQTNNKIKEIFHEGGLDGFISYMVCYPEEKVTIIILSNNDALNDIRHLTTSIFSVIPKKEI